MSSAKDVLIKLCVLFFLYDHAACLIIPEELPTILSLIYSNIPPIKKGTDSRLGVGFRLGEHADFQVLVELGPQTETDPIGTADNKRRRDAMFGAAMRGELGPLAQAVANYQLERKIQSELEKFKRTEEKVNAVDTEESNVEKTKASDWLAKWSKEMTKSGTDETPFKDVSEENSFSSSVKNKTVQRIRSGPPLAPTGGKSAISDLTNLYKQQKDKKSE
ncbi:uncharacterized protein LOC128872862 [Hylaeus volcanicus]|uniref:uncharacterized protein LOC128872862 n=1 Tax=Hylaeus volcanicus TaxID=313075 RepID=UPI0023B88059|nr:uncharacterized protein LOC128872862 [Hylaeus volcanicus]